MLQRNTLRGSFRRVVGGGVWLLTILLIGSSLIRTARTAQPFFPQQDRAGASGVETSTLEPGRSIEREISSGQTHSYRIALDAGKYLRVHVEQQGIDVTVSLLAPDGKVVAESRSDNGNFGPEIVSMIAEAPVEIRLEVRPPDWEAPSGRYEAHIADLRVATERDRMRVDAERAFAEGGRLLEQGTKESLLQAGARYESALRLYRSADDRGGEAASFNKIGEVYHLTVEKQKALDAFNQSLRLYQSLGDRGYEAIALNNIGQVYYRVGERQKAFDYFDRALPLCRDAGNRRAESLTLYNLGRFYNTRGEKQKALTYYDQALGLARVAGLREGESAILNNIAAVYYSIEEMQKAIDYYNQSLRICRAMRDSRGEAYALSNIGLVYSSMGEKRTALDYYLRSLPLRRSTGDRQGEAISLSNIGAVYSSLGEWQKALDNNHQALIIRREAQDREGEAITLNNLGQIYYSLGEPRKALDYFNQSLVIRREVEDRRGEAVVLNNIGNVYVKLGESEKAIDIFNQSLAIRRGVNDRRGQGVTLDNIGVTYIRSGDPRKALEYFGQALSLRRDVNDIAGQGAVLNNIGEAHLSLGEREAAYEAFTQTLSISQMVGDPTDEARALAGMARVERDRGNLTESLSKIEAALKIVESLRTKIDEGGLRASYLGATHNYYEICVDLLMRLHCLDPSKNHAVAAFQTSERSRARALIETLAESRAEIRNGVDPALLASERALQMRLESKADSLIRLLSGKHTEEQAAAARREIESLEMEYQRIQSQIRAASPRYAALTRPRPLTLAEIQQQALDDDALLLEYALGEERSYLWAVTKSSITVHELPPRKEIERAVHHVRDLLTARNRIVRFETPDERQARIAHADAEYATAAAALSQTLLGHVADRLEKKRLLIVADGALQYAPFAALPAPATGRRDEGASGRAGERATGRAGDGAKERWRNMGIGRLEEKVFVAPSPRRPLAHSPPRPLAYTPLIVDHEVVNLPSASALAVLRNELGGRNRAPKTVAVLADPVFERGDERFKTTEASRGVGRAVAARNRTDPAPLESDLNRSARDLGLGDIRGGLQRLPFTRKEAQTILSLAPADQRFGALDFAANQTTATSDELSHYRYVHFATHGLLNPRHPELSGVVLSLFNEQGAEQDGFLRASEVFNLNLPAELVVLSGCKTALGKDVRGEGLIGLTRGFMYAGAARVMVSLWEVNDHATSELMGRLYRGMLGKRRLSPAAALRESQLSLWREKRWSAPYFWAGFMLQGEPR